MCTEWLRVNPGATLQGQTGHLPPKYDTSEGERYGIGAGALEGLSRDLLGDVVPDKRVGTVPSRGGPQRGARPTHPARRHADPPPAAAEPEPRAEPEALRLDAIESLAATGVEVALVAQGLPEIWLVAEYTGAERNEMSFKHAATLASVCRSFPEARITGFRRGDR